jgi:tetratricopeptide (TPR) repeat protein
MPSIRELRDRKQRESFTGRQAELNTFRRLTASEGAEYAIFHIYGVGGIGKSSLLRQFGRIAQELGYPVAIVDMQVHFSVDEILRSIREQVGGRNGRTFADFDKALDMFNDVKSQLQGAVGSVTAGVVSGLREGVPFGLGALAVDTIGEEQMKAWLYRHLPRANADLYLHGERILTEKLVIGLNGLAEQNDRIVIMFDTYEQCSKAQDEWLRDTLLDSNLTERVLVIITGRDPLPGRWHEWRSVLLSRQLQPFTEEEATEYLHRRGITDPALVEALQSFTERSPWALAMVTDTPAVFEMTAADFSSAPYRYVIGDKLVDRFISQVQDDPDLRELVDICAVVRTFDHDVIRAVWRREVIDEPMRRLRQFSFVQVRPDGRWSLNQVVREFLDRGLRRRSQSRWTELNRRAEAFYQEQAAVLPRYSGEWNWYTLESLYHHLRLDEEGGILQFASLFEEAKHFSRYDFCSELLNNIQDVELANANHRYWLTFYHGVMSRVVNTFAWDEAYAIDQELYSQPNLPAALRARVTTDLGRYYYQFLGDNERAIAALKESLQLRRELENEQGEALVLSHLAVAQSAAGDFDAARKSGEACIELARKLNAANSLGWGYYSLGVVESRAGDYEAARNCFQQSLGAFTEAGYEFGVGVVYYQMGRLAVRTGDLDAALDHFRANIRLMQKYDKHVLAARAMVDICEIHLARDEQALLASEAGEAERLIVDQGNHPQMARLRLIQAETALRQLLQQPGDVQDAWDGEDNEAPPALDAMKEHYLDALLSAAQIPQPALSATVERIEERMGLLAENGWSALVQRIYREIVAGIDQALEDVLARHGRLVELSPAAHDALRALKLDQRWRSESGG